jgi:hypothetical protein
MLVLLDRYRCQNLHGEISSACLASNGVHGTASIWGGVLLEFTTRPLPGPSLATTSEFSVKGPPGAHRHLVDPGATTRTNTMS